MSDSKPQTPAQKMFGEINPKLADYTDNVLFGDVWERPELSKRDRSLITCAALVVLGKTDQMNGHFPRAIANGVTQSELIEMTVQSGLMRIFVSRSGRSVMLATTPKMSFTVV